MSQQVEQVSSHPNVIEHVQRLAGDAAANTDRTRGLPSEVFEALVSVGLARHFVPAQFGGGPGSFSDLVATIRTIGIGCPSAAWCGAIMAVVGRMAAYLPTEAQDAVWADGPDTVISASFRSTGTVSASEHGWVLSGEWHFLSGIDFASWVLLCIEPSTDSSTARFAALPAGSWQILDDWNTLGMRGTGSKSIFLDNVFVPEVMTFAKRDLFGGQSAYTEGPRYQVSPVGADPQLFVAAAVGAATTALRFWSHAFLQESPTGEMATVFAKSAGELDTAQMLIERACVVSDHGALPSVLVARNRRDASLAADLVLTSINRLFRLGGSSTRFEDNPLQRLWRDVHTLTSHIALRPDLNFAQYTKSVWSERLAARPASHQTINPSRVHTQEIQ